MSESTIWETGLLEIWGTEVASEVRDSLVVCFADLVCRTLWSSASYTTMMYSKRITIFLNIALQLAVFTCETLC